MRYIAHKDGERVQIVKEHLEGTAERAGNFAEKFGKKNILYYIIVACYSLYYCRGAFSNFFFDILFCYTTIFCIYKIKLFRR